MAKDFEQLGHKNIELLRFYLSKDIKRIDKKIDSNESNLISYFIASLVDIFVVVLFDDLVKDFIKCKMKNIPMIWHATFSAPEKILELKMCKTFILYPFIK